MKFSEVQNIWSVSMELLSNSDKGRIYYERAKLVITETLDDPKKLRNAMAGNRFRRDYLVAEIGASPAVTTQNPLIRQLLKDADKKLSESRRQQTLPKRTRRDQHPSNSKDIQATIQELRNIITMQQEQIGKLKRQVKDQNSAGCSQRQNPE